MPAKLEQLECRCNSRVAAVYFATGQSDAAIAEYKAGIVRFPNDARFLCCVCGNVIGLTRFP